MKITIFIVTLSCVIALNVKYGLDLTELFSYCWQWVNLRWD